MFKKLFKLYNQYHIINCTGKNTHPNYKYLDLKDKEFDFNKNFGTYT